MWKMTATENKIVCIMGGWVLLDIVEGERSQKVQEPLPKSFL